MKRKKGAERREETEGIEQRKQGRMKEKHIQRNRLIYLWWVSRKLSWYSDQTMDNRRMSALNQCTVQTITESEDNRCCVNTIFPPEDGHVNARNMSRIIV